MRNTLKLVLTAFLILLSINISNALVVPDSWNKWFPNLTYIKMDWERFWPYNFLNVEDLWSKWISYSYLENWKWNWYYNWKIYLNKDWFSSSHIWAWTSYRPQIDKWNIFYYKEWEKYYWEDKKEIDIKNYRNNTNNEVLSIKNNDSNIAHLKFISDDNWKYYTTLRWVKYWPYDFSYSYIYSPWFDLWDKWYWFSYKKWETNYVNINWKIYNSWTNYAWAVNLWEWWIWYKTEWNNKKHLYIDWKEMFQYMYDKEVNWISSFTYRKNDQMYKYYNWKTYWPFKNISFIDWWSKWIVIVKENDNWKFIEVEWKEYKIDWYFWNFKDLWEKWFAYTYKKYTKDHDILEYINVNWNDIYWPFSFIDWYSVDWINLIWDNKLSIYYIKYWNNSKHIAKHWDYYEWYIEIINLDKKTKPKINSKLKNKIDSLVSKSSIVKLTKLNNTLSKIDLNSKKYSKYKDILEYLKESINEKLNK